jgi:exopolysaccharide biosynthesis polyprenyl glycosylphosphotransferase
VSGGWHLAIEVAGDTVITIAAWALIAGIAAGLSNEEMVRVTGQLISQAMKSMGFSVVFAALVTLIGYSEGLYQEGLPRWSVRPGWILAKSVTWAALITGMASGWSKWEIVSWPWFVAGTMLNVAGLTVRRHWRTQQKVRQCGSRPLNVLIVGAGPSGRALARYLEEHPEQGRVVRGFLDDRGRDFGVLGSVNDLARVARAEFADELIVTSTYQSTSRESWVLERLVAEARAHQLDVRIVPDVSGIGPEGRWMESWGEIPVVALHQEHLPHGELLLKRGLDVAIASFAIILTMPVMAVIAFFIVLDSGKPVLYEAERVGRKGHRFRCIKFRTMSRHADAERERLRGQNERVGPCFKIMRDPRITRVGRVLRRYSLDELPQLWNVLRGDMSLVGPRPHPPDDFARYELKHFRRLDVTPGITGLWQVTARQDPSFDTNLSLDLEYIESWNLGLDLRILWRTVGVVFRGTGA